VKFGKRVAVCTALCGIVKLLYPKILEAIFNPEAPQAIDGLYHLTDQSFYKHIRSGDHFIKFYAPWCGHCQRLAPTWAELGKDLEADPLITIGKLDCTQSESICHDNEVRGYPTLQYFRDGEMVATFRGNRFLPELKDFVNQHKRHPDSQKALQISTAQEFESQIISGTTLVNFYAPDCESCEKLVPVIDKLATLYTDIADVKIVTVNCGKEELQGLCENEEVKKYPTLILYKNGDRRATYEDKSRPSLDKLLKFVHKHRIAKDEL